MKEDHILIEQLNASSIEAFSALYDKYAGMVFNFTHAILKDTYLSEDITQSCFALMWIRRTSISPDGNVPAWLYVVARNAVFKELRRQVTASKYIDYVSNSDGVRQEEFETGDTAAILAEAEAAIAALPESRRMIYKMPLYRGAVRPRNKRTSGHFSQDSGNPDCKGEKRYSSEDFRASDAGGNLKLSKIL